MKRLLLLVALAALMLGAAPDRKEARDWSQIEAALERGDAEKALGKALDYLSEHEDGEHRLDARRAAADAAFELGRWSTARKQVEAWLAEGGREDQESAKLLQALCLAREGNAQAAAAGLHAVASQDPDPARARRAARELVEMYLFDGAWKQALGAQEDLLARDLYEVPQDLDRARKAVEGLSAEALAALEEAEGRSLVGGVLALLTLEKEGALVDAPSTEEARRRFADRFPEHPLLAEVPGAEAFAAEPEDSDANRIGVLLPTSGRFAAPGKLALRGVELAMKQKEDLGLPDLEIVVRDTGGDPEQARKALKALVEDDKVLAIVGPMLTSEAEALAPEAQDLGAPVVMMSQRAGLGAGRDGVFNAWVTAEEQVDALVEQAVRRAGFQTFAIAYPAKEGAARLADRFWARVEEAGGRVTTVEAYPPDATDFRETGRRLKGDFYKEHPPGEADLKLDWLPGRGKPQITDPQASLVPGVDFQVVFVPDSYKRVSMVAPGFLFEEINLGGHLPEEDFPPVTLMGGSALNHPDLVARGGRYTNGATFVDGLFLESPDPVVQAFVRAYRAAYDTDPTVLEAAAFDATRFLLQLRAAGATTRRELRRRLEMSSPSESVTGARGFGSDGEMRHEMRVLQVKKEAIVQIWPPPPGTEPEGAPGGEAPKKEAPAP